jgi:ABC-type Fe3+-hydroxamate transport system substrate-binding protein
LKGTRVAAALVAVLDLALFAWLVLAPGGGPSGSGAAPRRDRGRPGAPSRLVPTSARAIEFLAELVDPARIAAVPEQAFEYATLEGGAFARLPRFSAYTAESVLVHGPDLVLVDPWQAPETRARLEQAGVRVRVLPEATSFEECAALLQSLSVELGEELRAEEVLAGYRERLRRLARGAGPRARLRLAAYSNFGSQGYTAGAGTSVHEILSLAGVVNAAAEGGRTGHLQISIEELLGLDPDGLVVSQPLRTDAAHAGDRGGASEAFLRSDPRLALLRALRRERIVRLPPGLYACNSHLVVRAAELVAAQVDRWIAEDAAAEAQR